MARNKEKKIRPARWLWLIPIQLILDVVIFVGAAYLDSSIADKSEQVAGHPAPAFTLLAFVLIGVFTVVVPIFSIIMVVISSAKKNAQKKRQM